MSATFPDPEVSVVLPCLDEEETLAGCIHEIQQVLERERIRGEIVVADNGSRDRSAELALSLGARVVGVSERGYGFAIRRGVEASRGRYILMGDADGSYDFSSLGDFLSELRDGADLVVGNRFKGGIQPAAMPWKNRYIGNPGLSGLARLLFGCPVGDLHCGIRAFSRSAFERMGLRTGGMELASEMVIRSTLLGLRVKEIPTILRPDRRSRPPHLRPWRDGLRHLRFMLFLDRSDAER